MNEHVGHAPMVVCPPEMSLAELQSLLVVLASEFFARDVPDVGNYLARAVGALTQWRNALRASPVRLEPPASV